MGACMAGGQRTGSSRPQKLDEYSRANLSCRQSVLFVEFCGPCGSELERVDYPGHDPVTRTDRRSGTEVTVYFLFWIPREFKCIVDIITPYRHPDLGESVIDRYVYMCRLIGEATSPGRMTFLTRVNDPEVEDYVIEFVQQLRQKYDKFSSDVSFLKFYPPNSVNFIGGDLEILTCPLVKDFKSVDKVLLFFSGIRRFLAKIFYDGDESNVEFLENYMEVKSGAILTAFRRLGYQISDAKVFPRGEAIIFALWELLDFLKNNPSPDVTMLYTLKHAVMHFVHDDVYRQFLSLNSNLPAKSFTSEVREALASAVLISQKMYQCAFLRSPPPSLRFVDINDETIPFQEDDTP